MPKKEVFLKDYQVPEYLIETVDLTFNFKEDEKTPVNAVYKVVKNKDSKAENTFILQADDLEITSLKLDGKVLAESDYEFDGKTFKLENAPNEFIFEVDTLIDPANNSHLMGVYKSNGMFCSQCEAEGFRRITLHPDRPDVMSIFTTTIIADKKNLPILLSNGNVIEEKDLDNGLHMVKWHDPFKKPGHLFAIVAGKLEYIADTFTTMSGKQVNLKVFTDPQNIHKAGFAMKALKNSMKWDEETYGREYDLDNFMIVAVDAFNMGAMENKGLNIFNSSVVLSTPQTVTDATLEHIQAVVGHEYFHNWSGNRVGCRNWFQLSLKEGFTVFRETEFSRDMTEGARKTIADSKILKGLQFAEDSSPMSHPVQPQSYQEIDNFYTLTVYEKGAAVVKMYKILLGDEGFKKGTTLYFDTFDGNSATIEDFRQSMEKANAIDLSQFHNWYVQEGTPILEVTEEYNQENKTLTLNFKQVIKQGQKPFYIPVKFGLVDKNGNDINSDDLLIVNELEQTFVFENITEKPAVSLLREFSAPVIINFEQSTEECLFLAKNDNDIYNRYQYIQQALEKHLSQAIKDLQNGDSVSVSQDIISLFKHTLTDKNLDPTVLALYLELPLISIIEQQNNPINPVIISQAVEETKKTMAFSAHDEILELFNQYHAPNKAYEFSAEEVSRRAIVTVCLNYLYTANQEDYLDVVQNIFESSDNMTLELSAFKTLLNSENKVVRDNAINKFYENWAEDNLVLNEWFSALASNKKVCDLEFFKTLLAHEKFNIKEPNKVRSVAGAFTSNVNFHSAEGYKELADLIIKLDELNPHMAAALVKKLMNYKQYAKPYSDLMLENLTYINSKVKSAGIKEILEKTLA